MSSATRNPWYGDGLRFACRRCGRCCRGEPGYVWLVDADVERMAAHLGLTSDEFLRTYVRQVGARLSLREWPGGDCVLWGGDERGCLAYPVRPAQCRTFPFWRENLGSREAWEAVARRCPGVDHGLLHTRGEIESALGERPRARLDRRRGLV